MVTQIGSWIHISAACWIELAPNLRHQHPTCQRFFNNPRLAADLAGDLEAWPNPVPKRVQLRWLFRFSLFSKMAKFVFKSTQNREFLSFLSFLTSNLARRFQIIRKYELNLCFPKEKVQKLQTYENTQTTKHPTTRMMSKYPRDKGRVVGLFIKIFRQSKFVNGRYLRILTTIAFLGSHQGQCLTLLWSFCQHGANACLSF